ncbi:unnamed protein product [Gadus morhua 'NCC']
MPRMSPGGRPFHRIQPSVRKHKKAPIPFPTVGLALHRVWSCCRSLFPLARLLLVLFEKEGGWRVNTSANLILHQSGFSRLGGDHHGSLSFRQSDSVCFKGAVLIPTLTR